MSDSSKSASKEKALDKAIEQTFPASDPIAHDAETATERPGSDPARKPPVISKEDVEAAAVQTEDCPRCHGAAREAENCPRCGGTGRVVSAKQNISPIALAV